MRRKKNGKAKSIKNISRCENVRPTTQTNRSSKKLQLEKYKLHSPWSCLNSAEFILGEMSAMENIVSVSRALSVCIDCNLVACAYRNAASVPKAQSSFNIEHSANIRIWFVSDSSVWLSEHAPEHARDCFWHGFYSLVLFIVFILRIFCLHYSIVAILLCLHLRNTKKWRRISNSFSS